MASWFLSEAIEASIGYRPLFLQTSVDDMSVGGKSKAEVEQAILMLGDYLSSHPAGSIHLHHTEVVEPDELEALGYRFELANGHLKHGTHVRPAAKRLKRHHRKIRRTVEDALKLGEDPIDAAFAYWKHWYASQSAWTKVPHFTRFKSWEICRDRARVHVKKLTAS